MTVLQRKELEASPLADLHAIASELGLEGFRCKRKADLIGAILDAQGGEEAAEPAEPRSASPTRCPPTRRSSRRGPEASRERRGRRRTSSTSVEEEPEVEEDEISDEEILTGPLDILANGSGFLRLDPAGQSRDDVYVSPAQIRRCELRSGDEVSGPVRPPRRNERHPSLIRVETRQRRRRRAARGAALVRRADRRSSRPSACGAPARRRAVRQGLARGGRRPARRRAPRRCCARRPRRSARTTSAVQVVLAGVRPEEVAEWRETGLAGGGRQLRALARGAGAGRRAGRRARQAPGRARRPRRRRDRLAARRCRPARAGACSAPAARPRRAARSRSSPPTGEDAKPLRWATTRVVLESGGRVAAESATLRADRLS